MSDDRREQLYEELAAIQHDIWSHWMRYLLGTKARRQVLSNEGSANLSEEDVQHWWRQIATPYDELSEAEKASDREQVDRFWHLVDPGEPTGLTLADFAANPARRSSTNAGSIAAQAATDSRWSELIEED